MHYASYLEILRRLFHTVLEHAHYPGAAKVDNALVDRLQFWLRQDPYAVELLRQHGLAMIARDILVDAGVKKIEPALTAFYKRRLVGWLASEQMYATVLQRLAEVHVTPVVQKGVWLSRLVYPRPLWRLCADIDLLVEESDMRKVDSVLKRLRFRPLYSGLPGRQEIPRWVDGGVIDCAEYKFDMFHVDVHFGLVPAVLPNRSSMPHIWQSCETVELQLNEGAAASRQTIRQLGPEDTLMHLALHAGYHQMESGVRALLDMALVLVHFSSRDRWNWQDFVERCRDFSVGYLVAGPLALLEWFAEGLVPRRVLQVLDPHGRAREAFEQHEFLYNMITAPATMVQGGTRGGRNFLFSMRAGGKKVLLQAFYKQLFLSRRRVAARYGTDPESFATLWMQAVRPVKMIGQYFPTLLRPR